MKSTNNTRAIIVGIFVFLGLAIFIITILTLGSQHKTFEHKVTVKSFFENVNGLQKGNNVWGRIGQSSRRITVNSQGVPSVSPNLAACREGMPTFGSPF